MSRQERLALGDEDRLEELWEEFPLVARQRLVQIYASLLARAAGLITIHRESEHESNAERSEDPR